VKNFTLLDHLVAKIRILVARELDIHNKIARLARVKLYADYAHVELDTVSHSDSDTEVTKQMLFNILAQNPSFLYHLRVQDNGILGKDFHS
jgi:hypothetical protein